MRWLHNHQTDSSRIARSISVGLVPGIPFIFDSETGEADGLPIDEANREVFKNPIDHSVKNAINADPVQDTIEIYCE